MSVQFGKWNLDDKPIDTKDLDVVRPVLAPYGPDGEGLICKGNVAVLYRALHTTKETRHEHQPQVLASGAILTWDGRLDNRKEVIDRLGTNLAEDSTDLAIVSAAYERLGTDSFGKLIGDWAVSIWDRESRALILGKDPLGTRHLYYAASNDWVSWCTILDPLVLFAGRSLTIEEEYVAGWLAYFPATHLTPYVGIHAVPPCTFVQLKQGNQRIVKYWDFDPAARIQYRTDQEYEEHFRAVFGQSICRRLRSDRPVLSELSGGMDSSSIVCMADALTAQGASEAAALETVSYYDASERNWDEEPYFRLVEERRGRAGCHIDVHWGSGHSFEQAPDPLRATPSVNARVSAGSRKFAELVKSKGYRVILSGIGGDEVLGGVPTPIPEIQDLLSSVRLGALAHQLKVWALNQRVPWFFLLFEAIREFLPRPVLRASRGSAIPAWLDSRFLRGHRVALTGYQERLRPLGSLPSFQTNLRTLEGLRRHLACIPLCSDPPHEKRYPNLDRDLIEFLCGLPREQLVRPGQRRSLMRRALAGIVPKEILSRKRKAYVASTLPTALASEWEALVESDPKILASSLQVIDLAAFSQAIKDGKDGKDISLIAITRVLSLEHWLRHLQSRSFLVSKWPENDKRGPIPWTSRRDRRHQGSGPERVDVFATQGSVSQTQPIG